MNTKRSLNKYAAYLIDNTGAIMEGEDFSTITECRKWAESYGSTMFRCDIVSLSSGKEVACHRRDPNGDGTRWFKATV